MTTHSGRRTLGVAGLAIAVLLAWLNGLGVRWFAEEFQLFGETADRGDHLVGAGAGAATAGLLFLGLLAMLVLRVPWWLMVTTAIGVGTQLALSITSYRQAQDLSDDLGGDTFVDGMRTTLLWPGCWPLILVLVTAVVLTLRASRSPAPPAPPAR